MCSVKALALLLLAVVATAQEQPRQTDKVVGRHLSDCIEEGDFTCIKDRVLNNLAKLMQKKSISLADGVRLEYTGDEGTKTAAARAIVEKDWSNLLSDILPKLVKDLSFTVEEGRGHKERFILPILAAGGFYALLITLGVIAAKFLAFKALLVGKISLVLAAITGLAKIINKNQGYTRIETFGTVDHGYLDHPAYR